VSPVMDKTCAAPATVSERERINHATVA
jgi:hypothetical protein